jgi:hypothetical protein
MSPVLVALHCDICPGTIVIKGGYVYHPAQTEAALNIAPARSTP